jgi:Protein of unknown function (DUF4238)
MPRPKRHHYIPEWYLKGFVDPRSGCLHAYDKVSGKYWTPKPDNVMVIKDYYKQHVPDGIDPDILEKELGKWLDQEAKKSLEKLRTQPNGMTANDTAYICTYLEHQRACMPRQIEIDKNVTRSMSLNRISSEIVTPELGDAIVRGEITLPISDDFRFYDIKMKSGLLVRYFARMVWEVSKAEEGCSYITSDSPVTFFNPACPSYFEPGIGLLGTVVFFPLDSQHLFTLRHPEFCADPTISPLAIVPDPALGDRKISVYSVISDKNHVNLLNRIMLQLSDKIIVGNSKYILEKAITRPTNGC